jgi:hypothetical protein
MQARILAFLVLLPCCAPAQKQAADTLDLYSNPPRKRDNDTVATPAASMRPKRRDNGRWNISGGLSGGSLNFQQNGNVGIALQFSYNLIQGKRSSLSINQGLAFGTEDEYGVSFFPELAAAMFAGPAYPNLDLSDGHRVVAYADFPLVLHYNFGAGAVRGTERSSRENVGFYIGGGFTHTFTGYTNTFTLAAQTDYWAWVADGGILLRGAGGGITSIGLSVGQPLRTPIGPIQYPLFFKITLTGLGKF